MIIDDEQANVDNLHSLLAKHCPEVQVVAHATRIAGAMELISVHKPELLFLDY